MDNKLMCKYCSVPLYIKGINGDYLELPNNFCPMCGEEIISESPKRYFSCEEVAKMSREEVRKNYNKILESMKKWNTSQLLPMYGEKIEFAPKERTDIE